MVSQVLTLYTAPMIYLLLDKLHQTRQREVYLHPPARVPALLTCEEIGRLKIRQPASCTLEPLGPLAFAQAHSMTAAVLVDEFDARGL